MIAPETIEKAIAHDPAAFEKLYMQTHDKAYAIARSIVKDEFEAEDIVQEAYISMFRRLDTLKDHSQFQSWFGRIVRNEALDFLRKQRPELFSAFESDGNEDFCFEDTIESDYMMFDPEKCVDYSETQRLIGEMVMDLPEMQRKCVLLRFQENLKIAEIAEKLDIPASTVKSNLTYGKKKLETGVRELEKQGIKLYSVTPALIIPFLRWCWGSQMPASLANYAVSGGAAVAASAAGAAAAKTGFLLSVKQIIAGVCAVLLIGGTAAAAIHGAKPREPAATEALPTQTVTAPEQTVPPTAPEQTVPPTSPEGNGLSVWGEGIEDVVEFITVETGLTTIRVPQIKEGLSPEDVYEDVSIYNSRTRLYYEYVFGDWEGIPNFTDLHVDHGICLINGMLAFKLSGEGTDPSGERISFFYTVSCPVGPYEGDNLAIFAEAYGMGREDFVELIRGYIREDMEKVAPGHPRELIDLTLSEERLQWSYPFIYSDGRAELVYDLFFDEHVCEIHDTDTFIVP